jgi:hypothetical protein
MHPADSDPSPQPPIAASNFCASFIDLLGQRAALAGQGLVPTIQTTEENEAFQRVLRDSVVSIFEVQRSAAALVERVCAPDKASPRKMQIPEHLHADWDAMVHTRVKTQRWSDGLVSFASLADPDVRCKTNGVLAILLQAGALCFMGLAAHRPLRGAVEVAWGAELNDGELYGAVVARAYELESGVAQYPRIVVGPYAMQYLRDQAKIVSSDSALQLDCENAKTCLGMIATDEDSQPIFDYMGAAFRGALTPDAHDRLYGKAREFAIEQLERHRAKHDARLENRYLWLLRYLDASRRTP